MSKHKRMREQKLRILRLFPEDGDPLLSSSIVEMIQDAYAATETSIRMQISKLAAEGFIKQLERGLYSITEKGLQVLENDGFYTQNITEEKAAAP